MQYRVRNWSDYNVGLKQRGSLTVWLSEEALKPWLVTTPKGRRGASQAYSDTAIATVATLKSLFHLARRQAQGFVALLLQLMALQLPVPDHSTVSRRLGKLLVASRCSPPKGLVIGWSIPLASKSTGKGNGKPVSTA